jgi:hypothetical protein
MRLILPFILILAVAGCTQTKVSKLDYRTYKVQDAGVPGGSTAPDRRAAAELCPSGYRVLDELRRKWEDQSDLSTTWTIRCL